MVDEDPNEAHPTIPKALVARRERRARRHASAPLPGLPYSHEQLRPNGNLLCDLLRASVRFAPRLLPGGRVGSTRKARRLGLPEKETRKRRLTTRGVSLAATLAAMMLALPALALAHLERPSYWPDPRPDKSVSPPAGGKVPQARSLKSAASGAGRGDVLVVCKGNRGAQSLALLRASVRKARKGGYRLRPSQPKIRLSKRQARRLLAINDVLAARCGYSSVQKAVLDAGNNDRSRDHARPLHRAGLAQGPGERPEVQPESAPEGRQRGPHPELRVPGHLPQRPEPDLRPGPRGHGRSASAAALGPPEGSQRRSWAGACGATCRSRGPGRSPKT